MYFDKDWPDITDAQKATIVSIALVGAAFGALFSGNISDRIGRKPVILVSDVFFTIGALIMAFAPTIGWLMIGRLIVGLGIGVAS